MSQLTASLLAELTAEDLDLLAERLAPRLQARLTAREPAPRWLNAEQAAERLACSRDRVYDLVQRGELCPRRDGRRLVFTVADLDGYLEASA